MAIVSNDPAWWPIVNSYCLGSYFVVAAFVAVIYNWALTFGQEVELIWRQRWSVMTVLYLGVRYLGILSATLYMLSNVPTISLTDTSWTVIVVFAMLRVIIIARLYAMYQGSRKILIFLIFTFLADNIFDAAAAIMSTMYTSGEKLILLGTCRCQINYAEDIILLNSITWILATVWEVLALCLAIWIAVEHFHELRQHSAGGIIEDCFTVLMKTHLVYFASFVAVSCFHLILEFSPAFLTDIALDTQIIFGFVQILTNVQMFVLGPRLIIGVREYHAKLVADADTATGMASIAFQESMCIVHISTGSGV
ncbi:uncharacterized protein HD556DRAFT_1526737 [Suillus plorans]|uniref:DUF6533 domain-containing protein n=1 Tax=Suillus plorans TaxID=116603 RepID=A0A9P7DJD5_9AGAM|nr:uncharacterized protein HD556DRAFT_1526737 [Suillus plorans]KAG1795379.1 hypothetical protein HD556DRAFT_1526737 [Suillus plorans]